MKYSYLLFVIIFLNITCHHANDARQASRFNNIIISHHDSICVLFNNFLQSFSANDTNALLNGHNKLRQYLNYLQKYITFFSTCSDSFVVSIKDLYFTYVRLADYSEELIRLYMLDTSISFADIEHSWDSLVKLMWIEDSLVRIRFSKSQQGLATKFNLLIQ